MQLDTITELLQIPGFKVTHMLIPIRIQIKTFECSGIKPSEHSLGSIVDV